MKRSIDCCARKEPHYHLTTTMPPIANMQPTVNTKTMDLEISSFNTPQSVESVEEKHQRLDCKIANEERLYTLKKKRDKLAALRKGEDPNAFTQLSKSLLVKR